MFITLASLAGFALIGVEVTRGNGSASVPAAPAPTLAVPAVKKFPVIVRLPAGPPTIDSGRLDHHGQPAGIACATCHATRPANAATHSAEQLTEFHKGLAFNHGNRACIACHNSADYNTLHLADGTVVTFTQVMDLCGQCHGPQLRDYNHGAHGGMTGYWDLTRGPRTRNNCVDCHDPHTPKYPTVMPVFPPVPAAHQPHHEGTTHE